MAVAETKTAVPTGPTLLDRLQVVSLIGLVYLLGCLGIIFGLLPYVAWEVLKLPHDSFLSHAALIVVMLGAAAGLGFVGVRLAGARPMPGLRGGIFVAFVLLLLLVLINRWIGGWIESKAFEPGSWINKGGHGHTFGQILAVVFAVVTVALAGRWFLKPGTALFMQRLEHQGWFTPAPYKSGQGQKVRRGTILGVLLLVGCGIWLLVRPGNPLEKWPDNWQVEVPFTGKMTITDKGDLPAAQEYLMAKAPDLQGAIDNIAKTPEGAEVDRYSFQEINARTLNPRAYRLVVQDPTLVEQDFAEALSSNRELADKFKVGNIVTQNDYDKAVEALKDHAEKKGKKVEVVEETAKSIARPTRELNGNLNYASVTVLPNTKFTLPLLLALLTLWFAWRVVNLPAFADFLIATEAEMNKVSWSSRAKLYQDTIVVLVTLLLLTGFLFVVDICWSKLLSWKYVGVLQVPEEKKKEEAKELKW